MWCCVESLQAAVEAMDQVADSVLKSQSRSRASLSSSSQFEFGKENEGPASSNGARRQHTMGTHSKGSSVMAGASRQLHSAAGSFDA